MAKNINHVSHIKSKQIVNGKPKLPEASSLIEGEIAINFAKGVETISTKNESGNVVTFSSDNYYTEKKLGSGFTGENSGVTVTKVIEDNEKITASALIDLDERKLDASAYTPTDLSDYYKKSETSGKTEIQNALNAKTDNSAFTAHTASTSHMNSTEKKNLDSLANNIAAISGITSTKVSHWDTAYTNNHTHSNKTVLDDITAAYTTAEKNKLSGIASGAEVNQNAFSNVKVGTTTIAADGKTDTLEIAGSGIVTVSADGTNDKITISASNAVTSVAGKTGAVTLAKGDVGLGNVDNTADANKTVKAATSAATADTAKAVALSGVTNADDLKAIEGLTGTSGLLKKTAANTWTLDTNSYSTTAVAVTGATYNSTNKTIDLKNAAGTVVSTVDATAFIKDGMVSNVEIKDVASSGTCLVITFNTDAGKDAINIPISQIFDASNYYTKADLTGSSTTVVVAKASSATTAASAGSVALSNVTGASDLKAIEALTGTSGLLKKTAANTWALDTTDYSNKNAFGKIKINAESTTIDSDTTNDTLTISGGSFVTLTSDATNDKFTIGVSTGTSSSTLARGDHNHDSVYQAKGSYLTGTTKYAGSSTQGGAATSAEKLSNTSAIGSVTNPVFFTANGVPSACTHSLNATVPSNAVFTDTKVTSVGNHYAPTATSADTKSAAASSTSELNWGSAVVTGVTLSGDAKGHITSVTVASGKLKTPVTGVTLASGTNNGTLKLTVNGSATDNIAVKGINTMAYQATSSYSSATQVNTALSGKSDTGHTHDDRYYTETEINNKIAAMSGLSTGSTSKTITAMSETNGVVTPTYANISITKSQVSDFPSSMTPSAHTHKSNEIDGMSGYTKPSSTSAIATGDTLNAAIGKLEKALDGKQAKVAKLGSTTKPLYTSAEGTFAECSTYAGGTKVTLNGSDKGASTASFYAPLDTGTSGQVLMSSGGTPTWKTGEIDHYVTNASGTTGTSKKNRTIWTGSADTVTSLYTGLKVMYKIPVAGINAGCTLNINGLGEHPVVKNANSIVTTDYPVGSILPLIYDADQSATISAGTGTASAITGCWKVFELNTTYSTMSPAELSAGTATSSRVMRADYMKTGMDALYQPKGSYPTTSRKISTASGLTGGGDLSDDRTIGLAATGTAGTYGPTADVTGSNNATIKVPQITTDAYGRVTNVVEKTYTSVDHTYTVNNGTFTISGNGASVGSTSANASANTGVNIKAGTNVTITTASSEISIAATDTKYTAATAAPPKVATASGSGTSTNYARQDHTHGIDLATGDSNGQVKIAGQNISVKGLNTAAYKAEGYFAVSGHTHTNMVTGSVLTANEIILGNGSSSIKASGKSIETSLTSSSDAKIPTSKAVAAYVTSQMTSVLTYKGTVNSDSELPATHKVGDVWVVASAGTYAGEACEVGDYIICKTAGTTASDADWDVVNGENQVDNKGATLSWNTDVTIATVDGTNITAKLPSNPNSDTKVRQTLKSDNVNRPLLMSYTANTDTTTNVDNVSYRSNSIYANASAGTITATNFIGKNNGFTLGMDVPADSKLTDTKVTSVGNHYAPSATSADTKSATASSTAELNWGSAVVTGVTLSGDAKGHITSVTVASGKLKTPVTGVTLASGTNNGTVKLTVNGSATDNIAVKGLNSMAYQATSSYSSATQVNTALGNKVDKVTGKGLSTNDYTTDEKNKLSGIESGAQVNVIETVKVNGTALTPSSKAVNVTVPTKTSDLTNNSNFVSDASYVHTDNNYTTAEKNKLAGITAGAEVNVQSDWNATSGDAFIKNKPTIPDSFQWFGTSSTEASTVQKEVSIPSITSLKAGQLIIVLPTITSTVANSTLKLNSFDAYPMRYGNAAITTSTDSIVWTANYPSVFVFDGSYWIFITHGYDSNTTYSAMSVAEGTAGTATTSRVMRADYLKQIIQAWAPQSDWNATSGNAEILNKPTIPAAANNGTYTVKTLVGSTTTNVSDFTANQSSADDITFVQGTNVTITPDATNRKITIAAKDTTYSEATTSAAGLMSSSDKSKLNGIESGAQAHKAPTAAEVKSALGTSSGTSKYLREDGTWVTPPDHTYAAGIGITISSTNNAINVTYGTAANTACQGNDTRLSNARPASDVYSWAKASSKPTYIASEVMSISSQSISTNTSSSCGITGSSNAGKAQTIIYVNSGSSDVIVTVPTTYKTPDGAAIELTCPVGGYCEVSYLNIGGTIYARGL